MGWASRLSPSARIAANASELRRHARQIHNEAELAAYLSRFPDRRQRAALLDIIRPALPFTPRELVTVPEEQLRG